MGLQRPSTGYLDGLRALSALWVLVAHCFIWSGHPEAFANPKFAVCIFMVLSGYVMAHTAGDFSQPDEWRRFYLRRLFRVAPLYYLALAVAALSPWFAAGYRAWGTPPGNYLVADYSLSNLALHASFLFGLSPTANVSTMLPDWSLSLEMQFYAAFPLIWLGMHRWGAERVAVGLAVAGGAFWAALRDVYPDPSFLPLQLNYFLAGILLHLARAKPPLAALAIALCALEISRFGWWTLSVPAVAGCIAALDRWELRPLRRLLDNAPFKLGADLSYGIYLTHGFFIAMAGHVRPDLPWLMAWVLGASLLVSFALHLLIERPAISWGRRLALA